MRRALLAAALALCLLCVARAQAPPGFDCAQLPNNWGQDQDQNNNNNNDNEPWAPLATVPGQVGSRGGWHEPLPALGAHARVHALTLQPGTGLHLLRFCDGHVTSLTEKS